MATDFPSTLIVLTSLSIKKVLNFKLFIFASLIFSSNFILKFCALELNLGAKRITLFST